MDTTYPPDAWERTGRALERRRGQLGYGFRRRDDFIRERGGDNPPSTKTIGRLERGDRAGYPESTITLFEQMYAVEPGSIEASLAGGELTPLPGTPGGPPAPEMAPQGQRSAPDIDDPDDDLAAMLFPGTGPVQRAKRAIMRIKDPDGRPLPDEDYRKALRVVEEMERRARGEEEPPASGHAAHA